MVDSKDSTGDLCQRLRTAFLSSCRTWRMRPGEEGHTALGGAQGGRVPCFNRLVMQANEILTFNTSDSVTGGGGGGSMILLSVQSH